MDKINENTLFDDEETYEEFIQDANVVRTAFWINNLGFLALKAAKPDHFLVIKNFRNVRSARISNITSKDNDMAVTLKAAFDKGYLRLSFVNEYTKLLFLLKSRPKLELDEEALRVLFNKINLSMILPDPRIRAIVRSWLEGETKLVDLIAPFYQFSRLRKTNVGFQTIARMSGAYNEEFEDEVADVVDTPVDQIPVPDSPVAPKAPTLDLEIPTDNVEVSSPVPDEIIKRIEQIAIEEVEKAKAAETTKIVNNKVVEKKAPKVKKTAADVKVTNKAAIANYDDDEYRAKMDVINEYFNLDKDWQKDYYYNNLIHSYILLTSIYSNDIRQHYINAYGDLRKAKKYVKIGISDLIYSLNVSMSRQAEDIDRSVGVYGKLSISPVSLIPDDNLQKMIADRHVYLNYGDNHKTRVENTIGKDAYEKFNSKAITPTIRNVLDAVSFTVNELFSENEYGKIAVDRYGKGTYKLNGFSPFGMYDIKRISQDEPRFDKSPIKYSNFTIMAISLENRDDIAEYIKIYNKYIPEILIGTDGDAIAYYRSLLIRGFSSYMKGDYDSYLDTLIEVSKTTEFDEYSNYKLEVLYLGLQDVLENVGIGSENGQKIMQLVSSDFFSKLNIQLGLPEEANTDQNQINSLINEFMLGFKGSYNRIMVEDFYSRHFPDNDTSSKETIEEADIKMLVKSLNADYGEFVDSVIGKIISELSNDYNFETFSKLPYIFYERYMIIFRQNSMKTKEFNNNHDNPLNSYIYKFYKKHEDIYHGKAYTIASKGRYIHARSWGENSDDRFLKVMGFAGSDENLGEFYHKVFGNKSPKEVNPNYKPASDTLFISAMHDDTTQMAIDAILEGGIEFADLERLLLSESYISAMDSQDKEGKVRYTKIQAAIMHAMDVDEGRINKIVENYPQYKELLVNELVKLKSETGITLISAIKLFMASPYDVDDAVVEVLKENRIRTIDLFIANLPNIMMNTLGSSSYSSSRDVLSFSEFFTSYDALKQALDVTKRNERDYLSYGVILAILSNSAVWSASRKNVELANMGLAGYKSYIEANMPDFLKDYVNNVIASRRRTVKDILAEVSARYDRDIQRLYLPYVKKAMEDNDIKMTPRVAKNMGLGQIFTDIYYDDDATDSEKKENFEEYLKVIFGDDKVTPAHLNAVIGEMMGAKAARDIIESSKNILPIYTSLTGAGFAKILKLNNFDVGEMSTDKISAKVIRDKGVYKTMLDTVNSVNVENVPELQVTKLDLSTDELTKITKDIAAKKFNGRHGQTGMQILDVYDVSLRPKELIEFKNKYPDAKVERQMYHGTGSIAANMILRFGFTLITGDVEGVAVTGKMMGNGIYLSPIIEKSMQYISDSGYGRRVGDIGYIFECNLYTTNSNQVKRAGYGGGRIRSPEVVVYDGRRQIEIVRAYRVKLISKRMMRQNGTLV